MSFLDSLMENMAVRTKGASAERISFMDVAMDESGRRMMSKSLSKVGKSKEVLRKEEEGRLGAVCRLGLMVGKKVRTIQLSVFVVLEGNSKQVVEARQAKQRIQTQPNTSSMAKSHALNKLNECITHIAEKHYSFNHKHLAFNRILTQYISNIKTQSILTAITNIYTVSSYNTKLFAINQLKQHTKQYDKMDLFSHTVSSLIHREQTRLINQSFQQIAESNSIKERLDTTMRSKGTSEDHSLMSIKQHLKELHKSIPTLELKFIKDDLPEAEPDKSPRTKKYFKGFKSPTFSAIEPSFSIYSISNIIPDKERQSIPILPLKLKSHNQLMVIPKQQDRFGLVTRVREHVPQQLHKLHPDEVSSEIQDISHPFGLFEGIPSPIFRETNRLSQPKSQKEFNKTKKQKIINLKNSFIEPAKQFQFPFCTSRQGAASNLCDSRKSFGLKSSRRIKESCVGEDWQRLQLRKLTKTDSFISGRGHSKDIPIKLGGSTTRQKCANSISIVKSELFCRKSNENSRGCNQVKRITSICAQFLSRLSKP